MKIFKTSGYLRYSGQGDRLKLVVEIDKDLSDYYRSLIPKSFHVQKPRWPAHCTVVRTSKERPALLDAWKKYEGERIELEYNPYVMIDNVYYWLNTWNDRLVDIRTELGLPPKSRLTMSPSGGHQCFHITIANKK